MSTPFQHVAVVGAGAVGSYFGARLALAGRRVTLIARPVHVEAIVRDGLRLQTGGRVETARVAANASLSAVKGADLVLFCVKSTDTEATARDLAPLLGAGAVVVSLQNGVENAAMLARHVAQPVVPAVVYVATAMAGPGTVAHFGRGDLVIGPFGDRPAPLQAIADFFAGAQVPVKVSPDVMAELWNKLMVNCAFNAISGLAQANYGQLAALPDVRTLMDGVVREGGCPCGCRAREPAARGGAAGRGPHRAGDAGPALVHRAGHGTQEAQRDRPPERLRRAAWARAERAHAAEPGAARAREAGRSHACRVRLKPSSRLCRSWASAT